MLKNKVAFITGCNRGIGKSILETFAMNGADIWACTRKEQTSFTEFINNVKKKYGIQIHPIYVDLTDEVGMKATLKGFLSSKQRIDIIVNNAGVAHGNLFQMTSINVIREIFEINFFSQLIIIQYLAKIMMKQGSGNIINISSVAGLDSNLGNIAYGSSKAALIYATRTLSKEYGAYNIRVNSIAPGLTDTEMADRMELKARNEMLASTSLKRLAYSSEIANVALFLASDLSSFISGQVIRVDGGM